jgi:membrane associated rhomboid family serine protease
MDPFAPEDLDAAPPRTQEFALASGSLPVLQPILIGLMVGFSVIPLLSLLRPDIPETALEFSLLGISLAVTAFATFLARRRLPDRVRITSDAVEFARGTRAVSRVKLAKLAEVDEFDSPSGKVLFLSDDRQTLAVVSAQLAEPRQYPTLTSAIVETVRRLDPTGRVARGALESARLRDVIARKPMRGAFILAGLLTATSLMALSALRALRAEPFPLEDIGAMSTPLIRVVHPEIFRLFSYAFIHESLNHLVLSVLGLLWLAGFLEKLVGWERVVLCFFIGVVGGGLGHILDGSPLPAVGSSGGFFGLIGLLLAITVVSRRMPRAIRPRGGFVIMALLLGLMLTRLTFIPWVPEQVSALTPRLGLISHGLALGLGFILGINMVFGRELPLQRQDRRDWHWFAVVASLVLLIGLVGGVTHHSRKSHVEDTQILLNAYLRLPPTPESAAIQATLAHQRLWATTEVPPQSTLLVAELLAEAAVEGTAHQDPVALDTLAVARYRLGDKNEAEELLLEALQLPFDLTSRGDRRLKELIEKHLQDVKAENPLRLE